MTLKKRIKFLLNPFLEIKNRHKKSPSISLGTLILAVLIFPDRRQPSIFSVADFTAVFEMGTGVSPQLLPPENFNPFQTMTILLGSIISFLGYKFYVILLVKVFTFTSAEFALDFLLLIIY